MPTLPNRLAVVRAAVASLLWNQNHAGSLYSAKYTLDTLNTAADFSGNAAISLGINISLLRRAFVNNATDTCVLAYSKVFGHRQDNNVLFILRANKWDVTKGRANDICWSATSAQSKQRCVLTLPRVML